MTNTLLNLLNSAPYDYYFLVVDKFLDINLPNLSNFTSLSPQKFNISLDQKNSGRLLSHPSVIKYITDSSKKTGRKPAIIPFKPSAKIDQICKKNSWLMISNPPSLNRLLEDKIKFVEICNQNHLITVPNLVDSLNENTLKIAQNKFGATLVIQTHFGWAGNSSFLINNWNDIKDKIVTGTIVKFSPYLTGYSLINNCCLTSSGLIQSPPGLQYTGLKPLTQNPLATVGRQWPSFAPADIQYQVNRVTTNFSKVLQKFHYRGFFGLDFLVHNNQVFLLECNPRLTASFAFYTHLEQNCHLTPLFLYHLAELSGLDYSFDLNSENLRFLNTDISGSEITSKTIAGVTIKKFQKEVPFTKSPELIDISPSIISNVI